MSVHTFATPSVVKTGRAVDDAGWLGWTPAGVAAVVVRSDNTKGARAVEKPPPRPAALTTTREGAVMTTYTTLDRHLEREVLFAAAYPDCDLDNLPDEERVELLRAHRLGQGEPLPARARELVDKGRAVTADRGQRPHTRLLEKVAALPEDERKALMAAIYRKLTFRA